MGALGTAKQYYTRGYSIFGAVVTIINSMGIAFVLIGSEIVGFKQFFQNSIGYFAVAFIPGFIVVTFLIGWWDMRRGTYPAENVTLLRRSPTMQLQMYLFAHVLWDNVDALRRILPYVDANPKFPERVRFQKEILDRVSELERGGRVKKRPDCWACGAKETVVESAWYHVDFPCGEKLLCKQFCCKCGAVREVEPRV